MVVTETAERICAITHGRLELKDSCEKARSATDAKQSPPQVWRYERS
jgi:hypothetical protein